MPKFEFTGVTKSSLKNEERQLERKVTNHLQVFGQDTEYVIGCRFYQGRTRFLTEAINAINTYLEACRPEMIGDPVIEKLFLTTQMVKPEDKGIQLQPFEGYIDTYDKKAVLHMTVLPSGDIRTLSSAANSRFYFNAIMRKAPDNIPSQAIVDHLQGWLLWRAYLNVATTIITKDIYAGGLRNRTLLRNVDMRSRELWNTKLAVAWAQVRADITKIPEFVAFTEKYVEKVVKPIMNRRFVNIPLLRHRVGGLKWWDNEDLTEVFTHYMATILPRKDWEDFYGLESIVPMTKEVRITGFREAFGTHGKFSMQLYPPSSFVPINATGYEPYVQTLIGDGTNSRILIQEEEDYRTVLPNNYRNVCWGTGQFYAVNGTPGAFANEVAFRNWCEANAIPQIPAIGERRVALGEGDNPLDEMFVISRPIILPPTSLFLRLLAGLDTTIGAPTIVELLWPTAGNPNGSYKILVMPELGINMSVTPRITQSTILKAKGADYRFKGQVNYERGFTLRNMCPEGFDWDESHNYGVTTQTLASIIGV